MKIDKIVFSESFKKEALDVAGRIAESGEKTGHLASPYGDYYVSLEEIADAEPVHIFEGERKVFVFSK